MILTEKIRLPKSGLQNGPGMRIRVTTPDARILADSSCTYVGDPKIIITKSRAGIFMRRDERGRNSRIPLPIGTSVEIVDES